jgi:hypothetical protein
MNAPTFPASAKSPAAARSFLGLSARNPFLFPEMQDVRSIDSLSALEVALHAPDRFHGVKYTEIVCLYSKSSHPVLTLHLETH